MLVVKSKWGWVVYIFGEVLWMAYGVTTAQWGFLGSGAVYLVLNVVALLRWHRDDLAAPAETITR